MMANAQPEPQLNKLPGTTGNAAEVRTREYHWLCHRLRVTSTPVTYSQALYAELQERKKESKNSSLT